MQFSQKYFNVICHKCRDGRGNEKKRQKTGEKRGGKGSDGNQPRESNSAKSCPRGGRETIFPSNLRLALRLRDPHHYVIADVIYKCGTKL